MFRAWQDEDAKTGMTYLIHYRGKPVGSIKAAWHATLRRAGITRRIRPYDVRHTFATELLAFGQTDFGTVAKLMGHSSPKMLFCHYEYVMDAQKRAAAESLPDIIHHVPKPVCQKNKH